MSSVEYSRIRQYGITPALCIIACLCFGFLALVVWDTILTIALERNNDFRSNHNGTTNAPTPSPTPTVVTSTEPTVVVLGGAFDVPVAIAGAAGKKNVRTEVLASKKAQLKAAVLSETSASSSDVDHEGDYEYKHWKADIPVAAGDEDEDDDSQSSSDGGSRNSTSSDSSTSSDGGDDDDDDDEYKHWKADIAVAPSDEDEDDDSSADEYTDGLDRFGNDTDESSSSDSESSRARRRGGSTSITFATAPTSAPTPSVGVVAKRDKNNAEIQMARGAIKTGNKYIEQKKVDAAPKQASKPQQEKQQQATHVLSMAERRQALIDMQKQARDAELQRMKRV